MKIYCKKDFLNLPVGTFFCRGKPFSFDSLQIKDETISEYDFYCLDFCCFEAFDSNELADRQYESLEKGTSFPMNQTFGRDGMYDKEDIYLVFEKEDLKQLIKMIENALSL